MFRSMTCRLVLVPALAVLVLGGAGCDNGDDTVTPPTTTPSPTITETFAGSITTNGAASFTFPTTASGAVTATLRSLTPVSTIQVSLALGTWNGVSCQIVLINDRASQGGAITGNVGGAGTLCVRISDIGQISGTTGFEIVVVHP